MKLFILDRESGALAEVLPDALLELLARPSGVAILMSPFRRAHAELDALVARLPQRKQPAITHRQWRYGPNAINDLTLQIWAEFTPGAPSIIALIDQPWHRAHSAWASSSDLASLLERVANCGGAFTTVYATPDVNEHECVERYRSWLAVCADIHDMAEAERNAFFALRRDGALQGFGDKDKLKERLGTARMIYSDAALRAISCTLAHFSKNSDQRHWQLLALALAADFGSGDKRLRDIVEGELQSRSLGWGVETFKGGGLGKLNRTTRALGILCKQGDLPDVVARGVEALAPSAAAFAALAGWRRDTGAADGDLSDRVTSIETTLRQARNALEHSEGEARSALFRSSIEQVVVSLEELARGAQNAMPTGSNRWSLGNATWMSAVADLSAKQAGELARCAEQYLEQQLRLDQGQVERIRKLLGVPVGKPDVAGLLRTSGRLIEADIGPLQRETGWTGWAQVIPLRKVRGWLLATDAS